MANINRQFAKLRENYLFPEISKKKQAYQEKFPEKKLISLGIGDTTQPIGESIAASISKRAKALASHEGYSGYGPEQGQPRLRELIASKIYQGLIDPDEVFISDGAKCDTGRLLHLFDSGMAIAVQDPTYPVYVDTAVISGKVKEMNLLRCYPENGFFPDLVQCGKIDVVYFCSPNNPTGQAATREQLHELVSFAEKNGAIIIFDAAYANFIQEPGLPKSIFEIEGAERVAIEIGSFSKLAGFTGVRLGWTVVPKQLRDREGASVYKAWNRIMTTFFNGASNLAQQGGIAALQEEGLIEIAKTRDYYLENASLIRCAFQKLGFPCYGGENAPFVWVNFLPQTSWEMFDRLLHTCQIISIPGIGFGESGEGYLRFSAFASREAILEAVDRISRCFALKNTVSKSV